MSARLLATFVVALTGATALTIAGTSNEDPDLMMAAATDKGGTSNEDPDLMMAAATDKGGQLAAQAAVQAEQSARTAWALQAEVQKTAEKNNAYVEQVKVNIGMAEAAAKKAKKLDEKATKLYEKTKASTDKAAMEAAEEYLAEVKTAGATANVNAGANRRVEEKAAEVAAAKAGARAAMPYHANMLRLQRVVFAYEMRARAMAAASNSLKTEGATLASSAQQYQSVGQTVQASQIMVQAHSLVDQGQRLTQQARELHTTAQEIYSGIPLYQQAEQAAMDSAAASANPMAFPPALPHPY